MLGMNSPIQLRADVAPDFVPERTACPATLREREAIQNSSRQQLTRTVEDVSCMTEIRDRVVQGTDEQRLDLDEHLLYALFQCMVERLGGFAVPVEGS
jgi:hypothetical protein